MKALMNNISQVIKQVPEAVVDIKYAMYLVVVIVLLVPLTVLLVYLIKKYLVPPIYKFVYRNYMIITEENYVVIDVRIYGNKDERLVIENEDMDRFIIFEPKHILAVSGDVLNGIKEHNTKTGNIKYLYENSKVYSKVEKGDEE